MIDLTWSSDLILKEFPTCKTLKELVQVIENRSWKKGEVVCEIRVNGKILDERKESIWAQTPIEEINVLHVQSTRQEDLAKNTLDSLTLAIPDVIKNADELASKFRNIEGFAATQLLPFLDGLGEFTQAMTLLRPELQSWPKVVGFLAEWVRIEGSFAQTMKELIAAFEVTDQTLIADLLEYDLANALEEWRRLIEQIRASAEDLNQDSPAR